MTGVVHAHPWVGGALTVLALVGSVAAVRAALPRPPPRPSTPACVAPALPGTVVDVRTTDTPAPRDVVSLVPAPPAPAAGRARVLLSAGTVPAGTVSLRVHDESAVRRELVVLPLPARATTSGAPGPRSARDRTAERGP